MLHNRVGCVLWRLPQGMCGIAANATMELSVLQTIHTVPIAMFNVVADVESGVAPIQKHSCPRAEKGTCTTTLSDLAWLVKIWPAHENQNLACTAVHCIRSAFWGFVFSELCLIVTACDRPLLDADPSSLFLPHQAQALQSDIF